MKQAIRDLARQAHDLTESAYQAHPAVRGDAEWSEKQRMLLADMALHLVQTALGEGPIDKARLQNNLYAILTISAPHLPEKELARYAAAILEK
jgi:hypothetical protein